MAFRCVSMALQRVSFCRADHGHPFQNAGASPTGCIRGRFSEEGSKPDARKARTPGPSRPAGRPPSPEKYPCKFVCCVHTDRGERSRNAALRGDYHYWKRGMVSYVLATAVAVAMIGALVMMDTPIRIPARLAGWLSAALHLVLALLYSSWYDLEPTWDNGDALAVGVSQLRQQARAAGLQVQVPIYASFPSASLVTTFRGT
jgi:hypothetical protein